MYRPKTYLRVMEFATLLRTVANRWHPLFPNKRGSKPALFLVWRILARFDNLVERAYEVGHDEGYSEGVRDGRQKGRQGGSGMPSSEGRGMGSESEPVTDADRARLIGWADAQVNRTARDELMALHVATGTRLARLAGFNEDEAIQVGKGVTFSLTGLLLDKSLRCDMEKEKSAGQNLTESGRRNVRGNLND